MFCIMQCSIIRHNASLFPTVWSTNLTTTWNWLHFSVIFTRLTRTRIRIYTSSSNTGSGDLPRIPSHLLVICKSSHPCSTAIWFTFAQRTDQGVFQLHGHLFKIKGRKNLCCKFSTFNDERRYLYNLFTMQDKYTCSKLVSQQSYFVKMKKWSSQWTQFMQLRKEAWKKKIQDFNGVWTRDLAIPVRCSTNWAMKPLTLGAGARFSKVPIINGPGKLSPFTLKIEVSIVLHLTW